ncbi:helix-turn-helix domain-containing protein [Aestuariicella hydrocarbonica]|uniref:Helix-turn-helix domain-containing protein n=1 Tax=Pseudomaricurvus hydrocarbonicus TaxID=1470433 RepID=A0A9E5JS33_9GAMM|nr:helix-turn-helix domain-containing protein [Aestuariicella hydrocarbonica]NHO65787.1 helix-turn-helix domain-containing protein [Aestuariicella hydrocarbonica]
MDSVQATAFINDLISILELVDQHFVALPVVSQSNLRQGEVGDAAVRRPAGKNSGWTLMLTVEGGGTFNCVRQSYASSPGDLVLLAPGALYDYRRTDDQPVWRHFWIYCNLSPAVVNSLNWQELGPYIYQLHLRPQDNLVVQEIFQQLFDLDPSEKELPTALRNNLVEQIFLRSLQWAEDASGHVINAHVKQAMNYIEQKLYDSIAVEDIAEAAGLSKARLSALFKNSLGRSMLSWRDERRMAQACQMLMNRAVKIHTVAQALGYDDALYFSRKFRQVVGKSPQAYRRKRL